LKYQKQKGLIYTFWGGERKEWKKKKPSTTNYPSNTVTHHINRKKTQHNKKASLAIKSRYTLQ